MTFVIDKKMTQMPDFENDDYLFDIEQYNYMVNRHNCFVNWELINNQKKLEYVLVKLMELDVLLLDQLQYHYLEYM